MEPEEELKPQEIPQNEEPVQEPEPVEFESAPMEEVVTEPVIETEPETVTEVEPSIKTEVKREPLRSPAAKKSYWNKALPWVIVALVFFLGGLATIYFALYQPVKQAALTAANTAQQEISSLNNQVSQLEVQKSLVQSELDTTRGELVDTQEDLAAAQATIEEQVTDVANAKVKRVAYQLLGNINSARAALEKLDTASARQALNFAKADLAELESAGIEADALAGFADRLDEALANLNEAGLEKSRAALVTLNSNVLLLVANLP